MIEVCGLTKSYGIRPAIQDVSFRVPKGEILGFLGPNGAGKTTTMRILAGCLAATAGTARVAGHDILDDSLEARRSLGYLPEQVPLYPEMRVEEYLAFSGSLRITNRRLLAKRLPEVMARCGLTEVREKPIGRLSRGYRQRVGLAQAILPDPPVLILDEPTVGLDPRQIIEVRGLIRELAGDHTVLLSTHILPEVSALCARVVIIDHGRVVAEDTPESLSRAVRGGERLLLSIDGEAAAAVERLRALPGVAAVEALPIPPASRECPVPTATCPVTATEPQLGTRHAARGTPAEGRLCVQTAPGDEATARATRRAVAAAVIEAGCGLLELTAERVTLEEVFVRLVTQETQ